MRMIITPPEVRCRILYGEAYENTPELKSIEHLTEEELQAIPLNNLHKIPGVIVPNTTIKSRLARGKGWTRKTACMTPSIRSEDNAPHKRKERQDKGRNF